MPKPRSQCNCHCHEPGLSVVHIAACCRPDACGKVASERPWWMSADQYDPCHCVLDPNHEGDCMCRHHLDDAA